MNDRQGQKAIATIWQNGQASSPISEDSQPVLQQHTDFSHPLGVAEVHPPFLFAASPQQSSETNLTKLESRSRTTSDKSDNGSNSESRSLAKKSDSGSGDKTLGKASAKKFGELLGPEITSASETVVKNLLGLSTEEGFKYAKAVNPMTGTFQCIINIDLPRLGNQELALEQGLANSPRVNLEKSLVQEQDLVREQELANSPRVNQGQGVTTGNVTKGKKTYKNPTLGIRHSPGAGEPAILLEHSCRGMRMRARRTCCGLEAAIFSPTEHGDKMPIFKALEGRRLYKLYLRSEISRDRFRRARFPK